MAQLIALTANVWRAKEAPAISPGEIMAGWGALPHLARALLDAEREEREAREKRESDATLIAFALRFGGKEAAAALEKLDGK